MASIEEHHDTNHTPTQHSPSSLESAPTAPHSLPSSGVVFVVYIVTDIIYPTSTDFDHSKGIFRIDSVHSSMQAANTRAKKIIYEGGQIDGGQYKVDLDKIIEDIKKGLFTGIGIGGKGDGYETGCYARKCQVESRMVDEDSEDDNEANDERFTYGERHGETAGREGVDDADGDVQMG
ncbi:hypothetical protein DE146DRAFT_753820 [Phaeosphaeria sp. MPI-PUGE-AT-0046c]|nr:hypothetical protein DE146DRAFT_753820 [Phaeosphaeria sp. MPI-PUGE-AT-0046c]